MRFVEMQRNGLLGEEIMSGQFCNDPIKDQCRNQE